MTEETVYTSERELKLGTDRVLSVQVNGGSLEISVRHGLGQWILFRTVTEDLVEEMRFGINRQYRFTPSGGATYAV